MRSTAVVSQLSVCWYPIPVICLVLVFSACSDGNEPVGPVAQAVPTPTGAPAVPTSAQVPPPPTPIPLPKTPPPAPRPTAAAAPTTPPAMPTIDPTNVPTPAATLLPEPTPTHPAIPTVIAPPDSPAELSIAQVSLDPQDIPAYDRDDWKHWTDVDGDCQDARQEVLIAESVTPVEFTDAKQCRVASGEWIGPFTGERFTDPGDLDVDHMVPLANAHRSGASGWPVDRREDYANHLAYGGHLIAVKAGANRSKGSRSPEEWMPPDQSYWCQYAIDWIVIKDTWRLTSTQHEVSTLEEMLVTCDSPPVLTIVAVAPSLEPGDPTPTAVAIPIPSSARVYLSCGEAETSGEDRVQGGNGDGRGFLKAMVPSARDGDGVVCEE